MVDEGAGSPPTTLLAHADAVFRARLREQLESQCKVREAETGEAALACVRDGADVLVLAEDLADGEGDALLSTVVAMAPALPVIVVAAQSTVPAAVSALRAGAFDYLTEAASPDDIAAAVRLAFKRTWQQRDLRARARPDSDSGCLPEIIGQSARMKETKRLLRKVAASRSWVVLISGETGTGKHLMASALHQAGGGRLAAIRCSAPSNATLDDGDWADTWAGLRSRPDLAPATLLLDEVDCATPDVQAKLLVRIEAHEAAAESSSTAPRIIATSAVDLRTLVRQRTFREDLYYHLSLVEIRLPPLREREGDVELLARYFAERIGKRIGRAPTLTPAAVDLLSRCAWPGNVRELKRTVERAALLAERGVLDADDFDLSSSEPEPIASGELPPGGVDLRALEMRLVALALRRTNGNLTRAAALLGLNRDQIRYRMTKFRL